MNPSQYPQWNERAAAVLAKIAAAAVSLFRPIHQTITEQWEGISEAPEGTEYAPRYVVSPDVYVIPQNGMALWRVAVWTEGDLEGDLGCLHLDAFGCGVEVWYVKAGREPTAALVRT